MQRLTAVQPGCNLAGNRDFFYINKGHTRAFRLQSRGLQRRSDVPVTRPPTVREISASAICQRGAAHDDP